MGEFTGLPLSDSVATVLEELPHDEPLTSWEIVKALLKLHQEYGNKLGKKLLSAFPPLESKDISPFQGEKRSFRGWLEELQTLYDPEAVTILDGRLVIIGLTMIDQELRQFIASNAPNFIEILQYEAQKNWRKPFAELLSRPAPLPEFDPAIQHDDSPARKDVLGRTGFAQALAIWLTRLWEKNRPGKGQAEGNSFIMNIYGPWGSGKSSLLNLLKASLQSPVLGQGQAAEKAQAWLVLEFNAWQHQHVTPIWWALLDKICLDVVAQLVKWKAWRIWCWEYWWRFYNGRKLYLISLVTCLLALVLLIKSLIVFAPDICYN